MSRGLRGHTQDVIFTFLSRRFRTWLLFTLLLPVVGRLFSAVGARVAVRNPRIGRALTSTGEVVRSPRKRVANSRS